MGNQVIQELKEQEDQKESAPAVPKSKVYITPSPGAYGFGRRKRGKLGMYCRETNSMFYTAFSKDMKLRELRTILGEDLDIPKDSIVLSLEGAELGRELNSKTLSQLLVNEYTIVRISVSDLYLDNIKNRKTSSVGWSKSNYPSLNDTIGRTSGGLAQRLQPQTSLNISRPNSMTSSLLGSTLQSREPQDTLRYQRGGNDSQTIITRVADSAMSTIRVPIDSQVSIQPSLRGSQLWKHSVEGRSRFAVRQSKKRCDASSAESCEELASQSTESTVGNLARENTFRSGSSAISSAGAETTQTITSMETLKVLPEKGGKCSKRKSSISLEKNFDHCSVSGSDHRRQSLESTSSANPWTVDLSKYRLNDDRTLTASSYWNGEN